MWNLIGTTVKIALENMTGREKMAEASTHKALEF